MTIYKAFQEALSYANSDAFRMKKFMDDKRLTMAEKKIILGYVHLRETKFKEILETIEPLAAAEPWVRAHRSLLLGITYNNKCEPIAAVPHLLRALSEFESIQDPIYLFSCHFNLFCVYLNLNELKAMDFHLDGMETYRSTLPHYADVVLRCRFNLLVVRQETSKAFDVLHMLQSRFDSFNQNQKINFLIDEFCFYLSLNRLKEASTVLKKIKNFKAFSLSANFKFMRTFLSFLMEGKAFYVYDKDFKEFPILYHQSMVLSCIDQNDMNRAQLHWDRLNAYAPTVFQADFHYAGIPCLFSRCLEKLKPNKVFLPSWIEDNDNRLELIKNIFQTSDCVVSKEELYQTIWGKTAQTKDDFSKLSQLIYRANKKYQLDIRSKKGNFIRNKPAV